MDTSKGLPKHISPDGLKDSIVVINFYTDYNRTKIESIVHEALEQSRPDSFTKIPLGRNEMLQLANSHKDVPEYFFSDGFYKIIVESNKISFNILEKYTGWGNYCRFIYHVLFNIFPYIIMEGASLRYISIMPNQSIIENLDGCIALNQMKIFKGSTFNFNCNVSDEKNGISAIAIVRLTEQGMINGIYTSIRDIEVKYDSLGQKFPQDKFEVVLNTLHNMEKDIFFKLLKRTYVDSLNPEW